MAPAAQQDRTVATSEEATEAQAPREPRFSRRRAIAISAAALGLLAVVMVVVGVVGTSDAGCAACHEPQADAFAESAHSAVACTACHAASPVQVSARIAVVTRMVPRSLGGVEMDGPGRLVGSGPCIACHADVLSVGEIVTKNGLRIDHSSCAAEARCGDCHSASVHGTSTRVVRAAAMGECTDCHLRQGTSTACALCHEGDMTEDHIRDPVWVRTHGPDWEEAHGLGDLRTCAVCHAPDDCTECHGSGVPHPVDFGGTHGKYALDTGKDKCLTCHREAAFCDACHQIDMPHRDGFLQEHSSIAKTQEDPECTRCHPREDCRQCHAYHVHPGGAISPVGKFGEG